MEHYPRTPQGGGARVIVFPIVAAGIALLVALFIYHCNIEYPVGPQTVEPPDWVCEPWILKGPLWMGAARAAAYCETIGLPIRDDNETRWARSHPYYAKMLAAERWNRSKVGS